MLLIHGYQRSVADPQVQLLTMGEIRFPAAARELRLVGEFLSRMADDLESGRFCHTHIHIGTSMKQVKITDQDTDVIVSVPFKSPPRPPLGTAVPVRVHFVPPPPTTSRGALTVRGYKRRAVNRDGLLEMKEVTFGGTDPRNIRAVSDFLLRMAEEVEAGAFGDLPRYLHASVVGWTAQADDAKIAVVPG